MNKVVRVTGGAKGIGKAIVEEFRKLGAKDYVIDKEPGDWFVGDIAEPEVLERFPDVQWKLEDMVADETKVAVRWTCSGTFMGSVPFAGVEPNGRSFSTSVMNFYTFDEDGKIIDDVAALGIAGILQGIGAK